MKDHFGLLKGRLGVYDKYTFTPEQNTIEGIKHQAARFEQNGGNLQQDRMIKTKRRSLDRAVWFSYQAAEIEKAIAPTGKPARALINPNKLKMDYDDKILSVGFEHNFKCGDVFKWIGTNTYWLIYLQDLTELAYFRGDIRKCSYEIVWEDENGKHSTYAAIRGPVETKIDYVQKHDISVDRPNHSLYIMLPANEENLKYFIRYREFYLQGNDTCWRVEATDSISTPGILEINAVEYYANKTEDDVEKGIVGGLITKIEDPNEENNKIIGETFIKPIGEYKYQFNGTESAVWSVDAKYPVILKTEEQDPRIVTVKWNKTYSGQFVLNYGNYSKTIVVESLF